MGSVWFLIMRGVRGVVGVDMGSVRIVEYGDRRGGR
jgi:hypothetical protein